MQTPPTTATTTEFNGIAAHIIDHNSSRWLTAKDIGRCLGYNEANANTGITNLYNRHTDEFTDADTCTIKLMAQGQVREVRIFSLRGCHLLAMLAKTEKAKAFRRWVLDILDGLTGEQRATGELIGLMRDLVQAQHKTLALVERFTQPRRSTRPPLDKDIPLILQLKAEGLPQAEIARQLKLSTAAVSLIVHGRYRVNDDSSVSLGATFS